MLHVLQILCQFFSWHSEYYCYLVLILRDLGSLKNEVKRGLLRKMAAFKSLHVQGLSYALYFINETNIHSLFVFILIYSVQLKVKVKTSYQQTTEALAIVVTISKQKQWMITHTHSLSLRLHLIIRWYY